MLVDELRQAVAAQKHAEIIEPGDDSLKLHPVDQEHGHRSLVLANMAQKAVLTVMTFFRHCSCPFSRYVLRHQVHRKAKMMAGPRNRKGRFRRSGKIAPSSILL